MRANSLWVDLLITCSLPSKWPFMVLIRGFTLLLFFLFRYPTVSAFTGVADSTDVVGVTLTSVIFQDYSTGAQYNVTSTWTANGCQTSAFTDAGGSTAYDNSIDTNICSSSSAATKALMKQSSAMCAGFIKEVFYTVTHDSDAAASISGVTASVVITDIPMTVDDTDAVGVTQAFGVDFFSAYTGDVSSDNGNLVKRYYFLYFYGFIY